MFIKQITVSGFKSYKEKTDVIDLDPGFNVIVGLNGSGKSNLFAAIEFALTLEYRNLRPADRSALLHHGWANCDPAFVEITFDNTDRKFPVNSDTVLFRRTIAAKKDKFSCNGKELSNAKQFLDMAGLTNPYFIVKQGKVQQLAVGTDAFRLKLLEDVTGLTSYESKLEACSKALNDGDDKKTEIENYLKDLKDRQDSLEKEASELKKYLGWDSQRRSIEYVINEREKVTVQSALIRCEEDREKLKKKLEPLQTQWQELKKQKQTVSQQLADVVLRIDNVRMKRETMNSDILFLLSEKERLKNVRQDFLNQEKDGLSKNEVNAHLKNLLEELSEVESKLVEAQSELEEAKCKERDEEKKVILEESKLKILEERLGGAQEFMDSDEMANLIRDIDKDIKDKTDKLNHIKRNLASQEISKKKLAVQLESIQEEFNTTRTRLSKLEKESNQPDTELFKAETSRIEMWKTLNEVDHKLSNEKGAQFAVMEHLRKRAGREIINGWEGVLTALEELKKNGEDEIAKGYYGLVIENIECSDSIDLAVETAAGNKLFYHVVKNRGIGMRILTVFNRLKLKGAPNFIPIEDVHVPDIVYPPSHRDYRPLMNDINCVPGTEKIGRFIFGPVLLCKEFADATSLARNHKITCVTTAGDKVTRSGLMSGGYMEAELGKLELQRAKSKSDTNFKSLCQQKLNIEQELEKLNKFISKSGQAHETRESKKCSLAAQIEDSVCKIKRVQANQKFAEISISNFEKDSDRMSREIYELACRKTNYETELKRLGHSSSQDDRKMVSKLRMKLKQLTQGKNKAVSSKMNKEKVVVSINLKIQQLAILVEEERFKGLELHSSQEHEKRLHDINEMIESISKQISQKKTESNEIGECIPKLVAKNSKIKEQLDRLEDEEREIRKSRDRAEKSADKMCIAISGFDQKFQEIVQIGAKLGTVPGDSEKYGNQNSKALYKKLNQLNKYLNEVPGINQKAVEQYNEITDQYSQFNAELEKISRDREELNQLISDIQAKRGDAILKNFRVLQEQFKEIFSQIVPKGRSELILYGENFQVDSGTRDSDEIRRLVGSQDGKGVKISVNFINKRIPEMCNLLQLSGGQKSVVALCLILAIQKIDPVPFYLFDEVDQALDPQYRTKVTKVIHDLATEFKLQFICTTFRREFLTNADKFFGVSIVNKCSTVKEVDVEEAMDFVEHSNELTPPS